MNCRAASGWLGNSDCCNTSVDGTAVDKIVNLTGMLGVISRSCAVSARGPRHPDVARGHLKKAVNEVSSERKKERPGECEPALTRTADLRYDRPRRK